jgi:hypothetical protein
MNECILNNTGKIARSTVGVEKLMSGHYCVKVALLFWVCQQLN